MANNQEARNKKKAANLGAVQGLIADNYYGDKDYRKHTNYVNTSYSLEQQGLTKSPASIAGMHGHSRRSLEKTGNLPPGQIKNLSTKTQRQYTEKLVGTSANAPNPMVDEMDRKAGLQPGAKKDTKQRTIPQ